MASSLKSPEESVFLAFKEIIKKQRGFLKAIGRQLIYSSSSLFLLVSSILAVAAIVSAWLKFKGFDNTSGSFRSTLLDQSTVTTPPPTSKIKGSVARYILNPITLTGSNAFQRLQNCLDGICVNNDHRCKKGSCLCNGICISNETNNAVSQCNERFGTIPSLNCQTELILQNTSPTPPPFANQFNFTANVIINNAPQANLNRRLWGCSNDGGFNNCFTISSFDRSINLLSDGNEWYFINFPRGLN
jgi:hypothetical protein